jgi:Spy/CpxP family protein refolding chaperone
VRDEAFRMIEAYLVSNVQTSLGLTDDEFNKILPLVRQVQAARRLQAELRSERLRALRELLASGTATETAVQETLKGVREAEVEGPDRVRSAMQSLDAALTPLQQAKYRVLESDVESRIRRLLTRGLRHDSLRRRDRIRGPSGQAQPPR